MTVWLSLLVFVLLNVFIYMGMKDITRHLSSMSGRLDTLVDLMERLNEQVEDARGMKSLERRIEKGQDSRAESRAGEPRA